MKKIRIAIYIVLIILILASIFFIFKYYYALYYAKKENEFFRNYSNSEDLALIPEENLIQEDVVQEVKTDRMLKLEEFQNVNPDVVAWIEIENTNINYPVLQGNDNDFYMNHNYKKVSSMNGSIFLDKDYSWNPPSSNLLLYGHNMKNKTMFQNLLNYKSKKYYNEHPSIRFTTNTEDANYEIISAFESRLYYKSEKNVFRYYYFINASNESEYNNFVENAKKASLYDTGKTAVYGDQLLTLSTCAYHVKDGRFVVVARKEYK